MPSTLEEFNHSLAFDPKRNEVKVNAVVYVTGNYCEAIERARDLADLLGIPLVQSSDDLINHDFYFYVKHRQPLSLHVVTKPPHNQQTRPFSANFMHFLTSHYQRSLSPSSPPPLRPPPLSRSLSVAGKAPHETRVIDGTAGLGRDSMAILSLGFSPLLAVERDPLMFALLTDNLHYSRQFTIVDEILNDYTIKHADILDYLPSLAPVERPDVLFLDPSTPLRSDVKISRRGYLLPRRCLRQYEPDPHEMVRELLPFVRHKIVLKRHKSFVPLDGVTVRRDKDYFYEIHEQGGGKEERERIEEE